VQQSRVVVGSCVGASAALCRSLEGGAREGEDKTRSEKLVFGVSSVK